MFPLRKHDAYTVAELLVREVCSRYGVPERIHSDQGPEFESRLYQELCKLWGIEKTRTAPYTPWSNGKLERVNQTIKQMVKHYVQSSYQTWDRFLFFLRMAYNFTEHAVTKCTPFKLFFSRCSDPRVPLDLVYGRLSEDRLEKCSQLYCAEQLVKAHKIFDIARRHLNDSVKSQAYFADRKGIQERVFHPGELVLREYPPLANTKLGPRYSGPWVVIDMVDTHNVEICRGGNPVVVHVHALKPYFVPTLDGSRNAANEAEAQVLGKQ